MSQRYTYTINMVDISQLMPLEELALLFKQKQLPPSTLLCEEGKKAWWPIENVLQEADLLSPIDLIRPLADDTTPAPTPESALSPMPSATPASSGASTESGSTSEDPYAKVARLAEQEALLGISRNPRTSQQQHARPTPPPPFSGEPSLAQGLPPAESPSSETAGRPLPNFIPEMPLRSSGLNSPLPVTPPSSVEPVSEPLPVSESIAPTVSSPEVSSPAPATSTIEVPAILSRRASGKFKPKLSFKEVITVVQNHSSSAQAASDQAAPNLDDTRTIQVEEAPLVETNSFRTPTPLPAPPAPTETTYAPPFPAPLPVVEEKMEEPSAVEILPEENPSNEPEISAPISEEPVTTPVGTPIFSTPISSFADPAPIVEPVVDSVVETPAFSAPSFTSDISPLISEAVVTPVEAPTFSTPLPTSVPEPAARITEPVVTSVAEPLIFSEPTPSPAPVKQAPEPIAVALSTPPAVARVPASIDSSCQQTIPTLSITSESSLTIVDSFQSADSSVEIVQFSPTFTPQSSLLEKLHQAYQSGMRWQQARLTLQHEASCIYTIPWSIDAIKGTITSSDSDQSLAFEQGLPTPNLNNSHTVVQYTGRGSLFFEPTTNPLLSIKLNQEKVVLNTSAFYAAEGSLQHEIVKLSLADAGGDVCDLFQFSGTGWVLLSSPVSNEQLIKISLNNETLSVDGNLVLLQKGEFQIQVGKSRKGLFDPLNPSQGLLQTFTGTGEIWLTPHENAYTHFLKRLTSPFM